MYREPKAYLELDEAPRVSLPLAILANGVAKHSLLETVEEQPHFSLSQRIWNTIQSTKKKRMIQKKKQQRARNNAIHDRDMYSTPTIFFFLLQKWCSTPKTGGQMFCNEGWGQGPSHNSQSSGRWNQKRSGCGGLTQAMSKAVILSISRWRRAGSAGRSSHTC